MHISNGFVPKKAVLYTVLLGARKSPFCTKIDSIYLLCPVGSNPSQSVFMRD